VETEEQHQFVLDAGCHYCQGYLFYRPVEEARFMELVGCKVQ
jgi:EAL domain-containing protein (putative c-di-GMP-specific phosphodiesterase class I)